MDQQQKKDELYRLLAETTTPEDIAALMEDLCTVKEISEMSRRLAAAHNFCFSSVHFAPFVIY